MSGVWEALFQEEKKDYVSMLVGWVTAFVGIVIELPIMAFNFICASAVMVYELSADYTNQAVEMAGLKEWWGMEHTMMAMFTGLWFVSCYARNKGVWQDIIVQMVNAMTGILWVGSFLHFVFGLQGGVIFGGKLFYPTLMLFALLIRGFELNFVGVMKEIHGFGADDGPKDEKTKMVLDMFTSMAPYEAAIAAAIATFGLPDLNCDGEDLRPWLVIAPCVGFCYVFNKFIEDDKALKVVDANGTAPKVAEAVEEKKAEEPKKEEAKKAAEPEAKKEEKKEEKTEEKKDEKAEEKAAEEAQKVSVVTKACTCVKDGVNKVIGMVMCVLCKVYSCVKCVVDKIVGLPWPSILSNFADFGTNALVFLIFWTLTDDLASLVFPLVTVVLPYLLSKAQERELITKNTSHIILETGKFAAAATQYMLFALYISKPI